MQQGNNNNKKTTSNKDKKKKTRLLGGCYTVITAITLNYRSRMPTTATPIAVTSMSKIAINKKKKKKKGNQLVVK